MRLILTALLVLILSPAPASPQDPAAPAAWLRQLRFSPDGQHVLAQDDAEVTVLTVRPFEVLFRMPAENATLAQFTSDSTEVVFVSSVTRVEPLEVVLNSAPAHVERWSIAGHTRTALTDVPLHACGTVALSPDGRTAVCVDFQGNLRIVDVTSGEAVFEKKKFSQRDYLGTPESPCYEVPGLHGGFPAVTGGEFSANCYEGDPMSAIVCFSPDARFVIAEPEWVGAAIGWDVKQRRAVPLIGDLRPLLKSRQVNYSYALPFAFVTPDLVLLYPLTALSKHDRRDHVRHAELVSFPSGTVVSKLKLPASPAIFPAADANFILVRRLGRAIIGTGWRPEHLKSSWAAAVELRSGHEVITSDQFALDVLGPYYVSERNPGEVGLYERGKGCQATVMFHKK